MKIQKKLFILILGITVPILVGSGIISYIFAEDQITSDILNELDLVATIEKSRISESIDRNFERHDAITSRTQLRLSLANYLEFPNMSDKNKINKILHDAKIAIPDIADIHFVDSDRKILFSTEDNYLGKNLLDSPVYTNAKNKKTIQAISQDHDNSMLYISGPLILEDKFLGVIIVEINYNLMEKIVTGHISFGHSGELILAKKNENGDAQIITPLLFADYTKVIIPKENIHDPIIQSLIPHQTTFIDSVGYHGKPVFSATRYVEETGWGLTVIFDKQEAMIPLLKIQYTILFSVILAITFAILASLYISNSISEPIKKLQIATKEIAKGNLKEKIDVSGTDEISDLAVDVKTMQKDLEEVQKQIVKEERLSAIGELSSRLSHDIRSPLSVINMAVSLLRKTNQNLDETQIQKLDQIDKSVSKMHHLVENVLDFVRTREIRYEEISLLEIIETSKQSNYLPENIKFILPTKDLKIVCDPHQIEIVLENLITNSIQAIGGKRGNITINIEEENEFAIILIQDSGPGIPEEMTAKIFDPLFTTKIEGTGLGLASCKSIIESHKGVLTFSNHPTTFKIKLPKNPKN